MNETFLDMFSLLFLCSITTYEEHRLLQVRISLILYVTSQQALTARTQTF